jgi:hypothetical protein
MPFDYNNTNPTYSDATREFTTTTDQNWVSYKADPNHIYPLKSLTLWFRGYPLSVGSFTKSESEPNTYTMTASGTDIWDVKNLRNSLFHDEFHYAYIPIEGDCDIRVKVESITNTNALAKAGLMIRDSLNDDSAYAMVCITPDPCNGVVFQYRNTAGHAGTTITQIGITAPYWIRLQRHSLEYGLYYNAYYSPTGEEGTWTPLGIEDSVNTINMTGTDCIGLAVTAHNAAATCTAIFSDVNVGGVPVTPSLWTSQDIGIKSNTAAPLYVTLQDSNNITARVDHNDPNIALACHWREWNIALSEFKNKTPNLDLTNIEKITLGVGKGSDPNCTGTLYFDDIRLFGD